MSFFFFFSRVGRPYAPPGMHWWLPSASRPCCLLVPASHDCWYGVTSKRGCNRLRLATAAAHGHRPQRRRPLGRTLQADGGRCDHIAAQYRSLPRGSATRDRCCKHSSGAASGGCATARLLPASATEVWVALHALLVHHRCGMDVPSPQAPAPRSRVPPPALRRQRSAAADTPRVAGTKRCQWQSPSSMHNVNSMPLLRASLCGSSHPRCRADRMAVDPPAIRCLCKSIQRRPPPPPAPCRNWGSHASAAGRLV